MMTRYLPVILVFYTLTLFSCAKPAGHPAPVSDLPPATHTGANVIAWHTDSIPYIASGSANIQANVYIDTNRSDTYFGKGNFIISSAYVQKTGSQQSIRLASTVEAIKYPIIPGTVYQIEAHTANMLFEDIYQNGSNGSSSLIYGAETGQITITFYDPEKKILAGTFSFTTDAAAPKIRKVRDGWFDVKYVLTN
ncbi:MAG: hypothetical protein ACXVB6_08525 [Mucilaginibacter sp.]